MSFEEDVLPNLLTSFLATRVVDVVKMKGFAPCEVSDRLTGYRGTITDVVFDPLRIPEVNEHYRKQGYEVDDEMMVIATTDGGGILMWGGLNSVYHIRKGEKITGAFDEKFLAFQDILDLTQRFKTKNKRVEINQLIDEMKKAYSPDQERD